jgi:hypothetical protein
MRDSIGCRRLGCKPVEFHFEIMSSFVFGIQFDGEVHFIGWNCVIVLLLLKIMRKDM